MRRLMCKAFTAAMIGIAAASVALAQTPVGNVRSYYGNITPAATAAAIGSAEQTFTVTGLATADTVYISPPAAPTSLCPPVMARVSAANTLAITFLTMTAVACTPAAGVYKVIAIR